MMEEHGFDIAIPGVYEPVVGWRAWEIVVVNNGGVLGLRSIYLPYFWNGTEELFWSNRASCQGNYYRHKEIPEWHCQCGFWSYKTPELLFENIDQLRIGQLTVIGEVALGGVIIKTDMGYRAEFATPKSIYLLNPHLRESTLRLVQRTMGPQFGVKVQVYKPQNSALRKQISDHMVCTEPSLLRYYYLKLKLRFF